MPRLSIIMPAYNAERYLDAAIESIHNQTFTDYEFIIVNDGSTDSTLQIINKWADLNPRIRIVNQSNSGIVNALNKALDIAQGDYIARMDADDISLPRRLELQIAAFEANPRLIVCGTWYQKIDDQGHTLHAWTNPPVHDTACKELLLLHNCFAHPSVILKRTGIPPQKLKYLDEYLYAEDYKLWSDLTECGDFANIPVKLLSYRVHSTQTSHQKSEAQRRVHARIASENCQKRGFDINPSDIHSILWPTSIHTSLRLCLKMIAWNAKHGPLSRQSPAVQALWSTVKHLVRRPTGH